MNKTNLTFEVKDDFFFSEAIKTLRTNVQFCGQDVRVIAFSSCNVNEGKTTISLSLAKSLSELGKKVLVIDTDMRKSVMASRYSDVKRPAGLSEILTGMICVGDGTYATQYENLHIIFAGQYPPNPVELLNSKFFSKLLSECRKVYDYVIVDTPPLGLVIDAAVIAPHCDGVVLVMEESAVRRKHALEVINQLKRSNSRILGVVRNHVGGNKSHYGKAYYGKKKYYYAHQTEESKEA